VSFLICFLKLSFCRKSPFICWKFRFELFFKNLYCNFGKLKTFCVNFHNIMNWFLLTISTIILKSIWVKHYFAKMCSLEETFQSIYINQFNVQNTFVYQQVFVCFCNGVLLIVQPLCDSHPRWNRETNFPLKVKIKTKNAITVKLSSNCKMVFTV
jgi:hypothetical protein